MSYFDPEELGKLFCVLNTWSMDIKITKNEPIPWLFFAIIRKIETRRCGAQARKQSVSYGIMKIEALNMLK